MPPSPPDSLFVPPLSNEERIRADRVAQRLVECLRQVLSQVPERQRRPAALTRLLGVNRNTCQRITSAAAAEASALSLAKLPGAAGLREFNGALANAGVAEELRAELTAAIEAADRLTRELAGSQSELARRLGAAQQAARGGEIDASLDLRRTLYECGVQLTGRSTDVRIWTSVYRPLDNDPRKEHELLEMLALIGHRWTPTALPLLIGVSEGRDGTMHRRRTLSGELLSGDNPKFLLEQFCSRPPPRITARTTPRFVMQTVDMQGECPASGADIASAHHSIQSPPPFEAEPPVGEIWTFQLSPTKRHIFDVFLHRSVAALCTPSLSVQLWEPNYQDLVTCRWVSRLPEAPKLQLLTGGAESVATDAYPRYVELCEHAFGRRHWDIRDFVGYRCDVRYPLWRAGYVMSFDFGASDPLIEETAARFG